MQRGAHLGRHSTGCSWVSTKSAECSTQPELASLMWIASGRPCAMDPVASAMSSPPATQPLLRCKPEDHSKTKKGQTLHEETSRSFWAASDRQNLSLPCCIAATGNHHKTSNYGAHHQLILKLLQWSPLAAVHQQKHLAPRASRGHSVKPVNLPASAIWTCSSMKPLTCTQSLGFQLWLQGCQRQRRQGLAL